MRAISGMNHHIVHSGNTKEYLHGLKQTVDRIAPTSSTEGLQETHVIVFPYFFSGSTKDLHGSLTDVLASDHPYLDIRWH